MLRPDTPKEGIPRVLREGESPGELSEPLKSYAAEANLVMRRPATISYSRYALEASEYAKEQGAFDRFHLQLYRAYWEAGRDLGDLQVIREVAEECDLNWSDLEERLEHGRYSESVMSQYKEASELGITGIPAFLIGKYLFTGARPYDVFKSVMARVLSGDEDAS